MNRPVSTYLLKQARKEAEKSRDKEYKQRFAYARRKAIAALTEPFEEEKTAVDVKLYTEGNSKTHDGADIIYFQAVVKPELWDDDEAVHLRVKVLRGMDDVLESEVRILTHCPECHNEHYAPIWHNWGEQVIEGQLCPVCAGDRVIL